MGMIEEVGTYVTATTGQGTLGTDFFLHTLPETTRMTAAILEGAGSAPAYTIGRATPVHTRGNIDLYVRSTAGSGGFTNPSNARVRAQRIWNRLSSVTNETLSGQGYLRIEPRGEPHLIERDAQGRYVFGASFTVHRTGTTAV